jgi:hypothetical protein
MRYDAMGLAAVLIVAGIGLEFARCIRIGRSPRFQPGPHIRTWRATSPASSLGRCVLLFGGVGVATARRSRLEAVPHGPPD